MTFDQDDIDWEKYEAWIKTGKNQWYGPRGLSSLYIEEVEIKKEHSTIVNIRGCNGSGKTSILKSMQASSDDKVRVLYKPTMRVIATLFRDLGVATVGHYDMTRKHGGCDGLPSTRHAYSALQLLWFTGYDVVFEGIIIATVKGKFLERINVLQDRLEKRFVVGFMDTPLKECLARIYARNGGKPINEKLVVDKFNNINAQMDFFSDAGVEVRTIRGTEGLEAALADTLEIINWSDKF